MDNQRPAETWSAHATDVLGLAFSADGRTVVTAGCDRQVKTWDTWSSELLRQLPTEEHSLQFVALSPDGRYLASGGYFMPSRASSTDVTLWDVESGTVRFREESVKGYCILGDFSPGGTVLATTGWGGQILLWDVVSGKQIGRIDAHVANGHRMVLGLDFSADGRFLVSASTKGQVKLWSTEDYHCVATFDCEGGHDHYGVAISADGELVAVGGPPQTGVTIWSLRKRKQIAQLRGHTDSVLWVDFSPDGRRLASAGKDQMVKLWDLESQNELMTFREHDEWVWRVRFSPDGRTLASCSSSGQLCLRRAIGGGDANLFGITSPGLSTVRIRNGPD
jgi:WD40 repeat protein